jgi:hypothetical protein
MYSLYSLLNKPLIILIYIFGYRIKKITFIMIFFFFIQNATNIIFITIAIKEGGVRGRRISEHKVGQKHRDRI